MFLEVVLLLFLLLVYLVIKDRKPSKMPPGPFEIPFFGGLPIFDSKKVETLRMKYGNVLTVRTGILRTVIVYGNKTVKDVMANMDFAARPDFLRNISLGNEEGVGVISSRGPKWKHNRQFVLRILHGIHFNQDHLLEAIETESRALVSELSKYKGEPINFPNAFKTAPLNIMWQMMASRRYDLDSKEVESIYVATKKVQSLGRHAFLGYLFPVLQYLPGPLRRMILQEQLFREFRKNMLALIKETITEHEKVLDINNPRDLIDIYLRDMKEHEHDEDSFYSLETLQQIISDMFISGSDTINSTLKWVVFLLASYPRVRKRLQDDIDRVVPRDKIVSMEDRAKLPYMEAFSAETLRYSSQVTVIQREAMKDSSIAGYFVPKDTLVNLCSQSLHRDSDYWEDADSFNPDRFIDEAGAFHAPKHSFIPFGSGRRQCLAENLARKELFSFSVTIIQNFDIEPPTSYHLEQKYFYSDQFGTKTPVDLKLCYKLRSQDFRE